ncbi:MAG: hypothetical protein ACOCQX_03955 [Candidatus Nanoarchaeia archaeon]
MKAFVNFCVLFLGMIFFAAVGFSESMHCDIVDAGDCDGREIIQLSGEQSAHAATLSSSVSYDKRLCCYTPGEDEDNSVTYEKADASDNEFVFSLQSTENSHISSTDKFLEKYYLVDEYGGDISCKTHDKPCSDIGDEWGCVLRTHEFEDHQHASICSGGSHSTRVCCKLEYDVVSHGGQIREETEHGTIREAENAIVEVRRRNNDLIVENTTDSEGNYSIGFTNIAGEKVDLYVKKPGYITEKIGTYIVDSTHNTLPPIETTLEKGQPCMEDCTRKESDYCDSTCVGINGCTYDDSFETELDGETADIMDVCDMQKKGWTKDWNSTHTVECCNNNPEFSSDLAAESFDISTNVSDVDSYEVKSILRKGKMVTVHVSMWD